ncbi:MAG: YggS family pyridoxal phosphate-dependent enzyme [Coxiellaceae bacterium]|nr:YggS family pyridoxal phosphate-dependent enzyme [Coxiellaceae bacterium]
MSNLLTQLRLIEKKNHRTENAVTLLAVSKKQSAKKIRDLFLQGQKYFGENYLQEALEKQVLLKDLAIEWHFIGHIQSNKTKAIAEHFSWVHSVDRLSIAKRLNDQRPASLPPLNVCIEINIDNENTKSGITPEKLLSLAKEIALLKNLKLRGLMIIPQKHIRESVCNNVFQKTAQLQKQLIDAGFSVDTLSMGMSADYEAAIASGATMVRIGTALFGERDPSEAHR